MSAPLPGLGCPASRSHVVLFLVAVLCCGCAAPLALRVPPPQDIPELEARTRGAPGDAEALVLLGAAYRGADRIEDALGALARAVELDPSSSDAALFLGLTYEDLARPTEARGAYERYLELAPSAEATEAIRDRVALMRVAEAERAVRAAVARELELADTPPDPTTIAVFPFPIEGGGEDLAPLGLALSGMVATDLAQSGRLTVLERIHVRTLLDELAIGLSGAIDQSTAARSGHILGAGRIVGGRVQATASELALDAAVIEVGRAGATATTVAGRDALDRLFDLEKALVLDIFDAMGVVLTAAERERVTERRTESLEALLAYGRGIEASYRGDQAEAARQFSQAARLDPAFADAASEAETAESLAEASATSTSEVVVAAVDAALEAASLEQETVRAVEQAATYNPQREGPIASNPVGAMTGVTVIVTRPGGGP